LRRIEMHNRKSLTISALLAAALILAACAPAATPSAAPPEPTQPPAGEEPPAPEEPVALRVYVVDYTADATDTWLEDEVVPAFQEMYPNVTVEFIWGSWSTFGETVAGYFAAGEGADIINLGSEFNGLYGSQLAPHDKLGRPPGPRSRTSSRGLWRTPPGRESCEVCLSSRRRATSSAGPI
jgi:ABC-type glycerol-3-phosphate transport system substrate-binding protein